MNVSARTRARAEATIGPVTGRFASWPRALASRAQSVSLAGVPAVVAHPDGTTPAPAVVWLHGRTARKELDPGRYLRWVRAGLAACAIDLPGHGQRAEPDGQSPARTLEIVARVIDELDGVVDALIGGDWAGLIDPARLGLGGMSAGGMAVLRRLCQPHRFRCASVEASCGDLTALYLGANRPAAVRHDPERVAELDPSRHLAGWQPIPLLVLHAEEDQLIPVDLQRSFVERLRAHYAARGARTDLVELITFPPTGAEQEHIGFGRYAHQAKTAQTEFFVRHLLGPT